MPRRTLPLIALQLLLATASAAVLVAGATAGRHLRAPVVDVDTVSVGPSLRRPALELPDEIRGDLRLRQWERAADGLAALGPDAFAGSARADWAFVTAFALVRADRSAEAVPLLPLLAGSDTAPAAHVALVRGEVLRAAGEPHQALEQLRAVPQDHPMWGRAAVHRAEVLRELGRTKQAFALYEQLVARPDPALGNPEALLALALHHGPGSEQSYVYLRRLWWAYPRSEPAEEAEPLLEAYGTGPTWQEAGLRAERLMDDGLYVSALALTNPMASQVSGGSLDACRFVLVRGRSFYKRNQLTNALDAFGDTGLQCEPEAAEQGAAILYLKGSAEVRKSRYAAAADTFDALAERYPETTLADDGLLQAGIALQLAGDLDGARERWHAALERFPAGDTAPESTWRLAFSLYLEGRPAEARELATALGALPLDGDPVHVAAGRYWSARWALYPDVEHPTRADPAGREAAVAGWWSLCDELPHSFYAIEAYSRLVEEAPDVAAGLAHRPPGHSGGTLDRPWSVRRSFADGVGGDAVALARLGLMQESLWELGQVGELTPDEMAWVTEIRGRGGDWLHAHDAMRQWLKRHPPGTLGDHEPQVLRIGYPDRYWTEVQAAAGGYRYEPRLLHALIREESNFNRSITSHAGARGLSQLMPATAQEVAGWLGKRVSDADLANPSTNLELGAKYLDALHRQHRDSPYLSLVAYNAGAGRVKRWRGEWGEVPTDEFVERVPYKETRDYVRRVMGTWQIMRWQFDDGPAFPDLSAYNHTVMPSG